MIVTMKSEDYFETEMGALTRAARPHLSIASIQFSDGTTLSTEPGDIVVLVGPNNSGKTVALKNIESKIIARSNRGVVVKAVETSAQGSSESLVQWLEATSSVVTDSSGNVVYRGMGQALAERQASVWWQAHDKGLQTLGYFFVCRLTTEGRLVAANPAQRIKLTTEPFTHPIHYLERYESIEAQFSGLFEAAFGEDLVLHRNAGSESPLLCGAKPFPDKDRGEDRLSVEYQARLEKLPPLHEQGDGMRAFVGVLLHSLVREHSIVLIDEPEAFLHPPQARMMGQTLARRLPEDRQLVLATHSGYLLRGLLEAGSDRVKVVRLTRQGEINPVRHLDSKGVRGLWQDPLLRHSNILDGLFYEKVVVCEGDADCRFYAALMDSLKSGEESHDSQQVMFTHCGGKDRIPVVADALAALGVPLSIAVDFDILRDEHTLRRIWEAIGGGWTSVEADWRRVKRAISEKRPDLATADVRDGIERLLSGVEQEYLPEETAKEIRKILRKSSPWRQAGSIGIKYVPSGEPTLRCRNLFQTLNERGLFPNEEGELESFVKSVGSHGPKWVLEVLETKDLTADPGLDAARSFVRSILGFRGIMQSRDALIPPQVGAESE